MEEPTNPEIKTKTETETAEDVARRIADQQGRPTHVGVDEIQEIISRGGRETLGLHADNEQIEVTNG